MDTMEVNKIVAAILVAGIVFFLTGLIGDGLVHQTKPAKTAIAIQVAPETTTAEAKPEEVPPIAPLLVKANEKDGEAFAKKVCAACHTFNKGGPAGVGPNLYGVVGGPHAHMQGFDYSSALKSKQGPWTYEELNEWLHKPSGYAPGTKMSFPGISNPQERANVIAFLRTDSDKPEPLPSAEEVAKAEQAAKPRPSAPSPQAQQPPAIDALLAKADPAKGKEEVEKVCSACHTFEKGQPAGMGPNLYGVVGAPHGHMQGFDYSSALKSKQGPWTYAELDEWLHKPSEYAPGTKMAFPGIPNAPLRADVIAYLRTLSDHPEPLPTAKEAGGETQKPAQPEQAQPKQGTQTAPAGASEQQTQTEKKASETSSQPAAPVAPNQGNQSPQPAAKSP